MRVCVVVLSLTICAAGCARKQPEAPQPEPAPVAPASPTASEPAKPTTATPSTANETPEKQPENPPARKAAAPPKSTASGKPAAPTTPSKSTATAPAKPAVPSTPPKQTAAAPAKPRAPSTPPIPAATPTAPATPTLDLAALKEQLKSTKAIGLMTKLTLKNQVDDLLDEFRDHYAGKGKATMPQLRQSYDLLMMKVLSLLQDKDKKLASDIVASREVIWALLADPKKFATLDV